MFPHALPVTKVDNGQLHAGPLTESFETDREDNAYTSPAAKPTATDGIKAFPYDFPPLLELEA